MFSGAIWSSTLWALCQSTQNTPLVSSILPTSWEDPTSHPGSEEGWSMQVGLVYLCLLMTKMIGVNIKWISEMFLHPNTTLCPSSTERSRVTRTWLHQGCLLFVDQMPLHPRLPWCNSFGFACSLLTERPCAHVYLKQLLWVCLFFVDRTRLPPVLKYAVPYEWQWRHSSLWHLHRYCKCFSC